MSHQVLSFEKLYEQQIMNQRAAKGGKDEKMPDVTKERDKFADIVDAVGIAPSLLKGGREDADTNLPSKLPWRLPEECGPFLVWILDNYTSSDFKALRKANFHDVSLETAGKLINGFCSILTGLGFSGYTVERQRRKCHHGCATLLGAAAVKWKAPSVIYPSSSTNMMRPALE